MRAEDFKGVPSRRSSFPKVYNQAQSFDFGLKPEAGEPLLRLDECFESINPEYTQPPHQHDGIPGQA